MKTIRRPLGLALALVVSLVLGSAAAPALTASGRVAAKTPPGNRSASPTNSSSAASEVLATGRVLDAGQDLRGAKVTVFAVPDAKAINQAGSLRMMPLDQTRTGRSGAFTLKADLAALDAPYVDTAGGIDLSVMVSDRTRSITWERTVFPRKADVPRFTFDLGRGTAEEAGNSPRTWVTNKGTRFGPARAYRASQTGVTRPLVGIQRYARTYFNAGPAERQLLLRPLSKASLLSPTVAAREECGYYYWGGLYKTNRKEKYLNVYSEAGIPVTLKQGASGSTSHTMGVAVELNGNWSTSGTTTESYNQSVTQNGVINSSVGNRVNYRQQFQMCFPGSKWKQYSMYDWLTDFAQVAHVNTGNNCSPKSAGSDWNTGSAKNVTYGAGVDLPAINVSAQSGYGSSQDMTFKFNVAGKICGNNSQGPIHSSQVDARNNS